MMPKRLGIYDWSGPDPSALDYDALERQAEADGVAFAHVTAELDRKMAAPTLASAILAELEFSEDDHPRDESGKFTSGGDSGLEPLLPGGEGPGGNGQDAYGALAEPSADLIKTTADQTRGGVLSALGDFLHDPPEGVVVDPSGTGFTDAMGNHVSENEILHDVARSAVSMIQNSGDITVLLEPELFREVLADGRFLNQFESQRSNGSYSPAMRTEYERDAMGVDPDAPHADRPIYGTFDFDTELGGEVRDAYGSVAVDLKGDVRDRSTGTLGDSLLRAVPIPLDRNVEVSDDSALAAVGRSSDLIYELTASALSNYPGFEDSFDGYESEPWTNGDYPEAQIHGGVNVSDISFVTFTGEGEMDRGEITAELDRLGIGWNEAA